MNKITIIGSDSFIASKFIELCQAKESLKLFSRRLSGKLNEIKKDDLFQLISNDFEGSKVVMNFAAIVHQPNLKDDVLYKKINTELPIHLANEAKKAGVKHFIQMSTIAVYGNVNSIDIYTPENPVNIYGVSKLAADTALLAMQDKDFKVSIIRSPMVYGGGKAPGNMMRMIKLVDLGIPLPFRNIDNQRDFINIKNFILFFEKVIEKEISGICLISDKNPISTSDLISIISKHLNNKIILFKIPKCILLLISCFVPELVEKLYGTLRINVENTDNKNIFEPEYTPEDGIKEMVDWYLNSKTKIQ